MMVMTMASIMMTPRISLTASHLSSATPTHLDLPLFTVVLRLHLGIDLKVAVLQQFSLNALNGVGGESISISATDKVRKLRSILE